MAKQAGADVAKFQKRDNKLLLSENQYNLPHPVPENSYGETYGAHREYLEFNLDQHKELKKYSESIGIEYSTSVWEVKSAKEIITINPSLIKVPSACNNNFEMLRILRDEFEGEVHVSFGMTTHEEEESVVSFFEEKNQANDRLIIYSCTRGYPVPFEDISLLEIKRLYSRYGNRVKEIGFSGHHLGIAVDIAAYTLGACWIERHFTKDRTWKGTDHAASLEFPGLQKLVRDLHHTHDALSYKKSEILEIEMVQRKKLKNN
jgi:N-acetylneuraminate synthase